jgi:hypothetical protein
VPAQAGYSADSPQRVSFVMPSGKREYLVGRKFGQLTVLSESEEEFPMRKCVCDCGEVVLRSIASLKSENPMCLPCSLRGAWEAKRTHGMWQTPEYRAWAHIKDRCFNPSTIEFHNYGGRGITMCEEWRNSFADFLRDVGLRPSKKHSIDRINNDGNYEPGNCRWATKKQQVRNTRKNVYFTHNGVTKLLIEWSEDVGMSPYTLAYRIKAGWSSEKVLSTQPLYNHGNRQLLKRASLPL